MCKYVYDKHINGIFLQTPFSPISGIQHQNTFPNMQDSFHFYRDKIEQFSLGTHFCRFRREKEKKTREEKRILFERCKMKLK